MRNEIMVTIEHKREKKSKVSFSALVKKTIVTSLILSSVLTGVVPPVQVGAASEDATVTSNYALSVESAVYNTNRVIATLNNMLASGVVSEDTLSDLATKLTDLTRSVQAQGPTDDVTLTVMQAPTTLRQVTVSSDALLKAKIALSDLQDTVENYGKTTSSTSQTTQENEPLASSSPTKFSDVKSGSTYYKAITYLAKKGCLGGYSDGTFKTSTTMSNAKFLSILMRAIDSKQSRASKGNDYNESVLQNAYKKGIVKQTELSAKNYNTGLTREDMLLWISRSLDYLDEKVLVEPDIENLATDYTKLDEEHRTALREVYTTGIYVQAKTGKLEPTKKVTRGTAINAIYKLVYKKARKNLTSIKKTIPTVTQVAMAGQKVTHYEKTKNRNVLVHNGDTWVTKANKKIKIKSLYFLGTEVPGYFNTGVSLDLYTGMMYGKEALKEGDLGGTWYTADGREDSTYTGQPLKTAKDLDGNTVSYFATQWNIISIYEGELADKVKSPKDGQKVGRFTYYSADLGLWCFTVDWNR